jgi:hypothetical protein
MSGVLQMAKENLNVLAQFLGSNSFSGFHATERSVHVAYSALQHCLLSPPPRESPLFLKLHNYNEDTFYEGRFKTASFY